MLTHKQNAARHCQYCLQVHSDNGIDGDGVQSVPRVPIAAGDGPETGKKKSEEKSIKQKKKLRENVRNNDGI